MGRFFIIIIIITSIIIISIRILILYNTIDYLSLYLSQYLSYHI